MFISVSLFMLVAIIILNALVKALENSQEFIIGLIVAAIVGYSLVSACYWALIGACLFGYFLVFSGVRYNEQ